MAGMNAVARFVTSRVTQTICALGLTQIISWGTSLYALGVLGKPIAADTGWSQTLVFGGLTVGLLTSSLISAFVGKLIDVRGGRAIMCLGSILLSAGLVILSQVQSPMAYLAAWAFLGIGMRMTLYDAAFPSLVQVMPSQGRRAISYLTLYGGFASSVFWPIGHALNNAYGWRTALIVFALVNIVLTLPLTWIALSWREEAVKPAAADAATAQATGPARPLEGTARLIAMVLFGIIVALSAIVFGAMAVHLVPVLEATGLAAGTAVFLASLKGFAQVGGRIWDLVFARHWHALDVGRVSIAFMPLAFLVLMLGGSSFATAFAFILLFGISNGLVTIIRGAVPLALFGPKGYGVVLGILATPYLVLAAVSPACFALVVERWGYGVGEALLFASGFLSFVGMELMTIWYRRRERSAAAA
jgi:MFS family permease